MKDIFEELKQDIITAIDNAKAEATPEPEWPDTLEEAQKKYEYIGYDNGRYRGAIVKGCIVYTENIISSHAIIDKETSDGWYKHNIHKFYHFDTDRELHLWLAFAEKEDQE